MQNIVLVGGVLVAVVTADAGTGTTYSAETLRLRLRRLEEENAVLIEQTASLRRALPNCTAFVRTGGCDPEGPFEQKESCSELIPSGASGYCECRSGRLGRVTCQHEPFRCDEVCQPGASHLAQVDVKGLTQTAVGP